MSVSTPAVAPPSVAPAVRGRAATAARTLGALALLQLALPANLALTGAALLRSLFVPETRAVAAAPRTILLSGGKMTKALALARSFHRAGHRVVLVESAGYRTTGHRFSRAVDRFYVVPKAGSDGYAAALLDIVRREGVDLYVPVCSPAASWYDALAAPVLAPYCEVLHCDADTVARLDDKHEFLALAASLGLPVPDSHLVRAPAEVAGFDFAAADPPYVLKSIAYDPVHRLDLTPLPRPSAAQTAAFAAARPISAGNPWILQQFVPGREFCTHSTVRNGRIQVWACCPSSAFQVNYEMVDNPAIEAWVRGFVEPLGLTGQVSFDFIQTEDGRVLPIECNPRTHSAITMFHDHPGLAAAYLDEGPMVTPVPGSRPTYWLYHELWRLLSRPAGVRERLRVLCRGTDAIFDPADPLPFFVTHHVHIPWLLLRALVAGRDWIRVDFNIGKLVEPAGD
jgi:predicted ATP-grasp superfamily ATP-dependent carboligase